MHFRFIDNVREKSATRIVATKQLLAEEEYLADHFPSFPVMPGVLMIETMVQAAFELLGDRTSAGKPYVLGEVQALKFGAMVRPGDTLEVEVEIKKELDDGSINFRGTGRVRSGTTGSAADGSTAVNGRFTLRPIRRTAAAIPA